MSGTEHDSTLAPGFHALEALHRGAASTVYRARRDSDNAVCVLKVARGEQGAVEFDRMRELSGIPGVVDVLGHGWTSSGRAFVAMEYYSDGDFAAELRRRGPLPVAEVLRAGRVVAAALSAVHERGILHHGVAPANLLRCGERVALADAGAVLPAGQTPAPIGPDPEAVVHTPPEVLRGEPACAASDVYRLATTLWTLLVGHPPFADGPETRVDPFDYRERVLRRDPPRLLRSDLPGALRPVFERALDPVPERRSASAAEFAEALAAHGGAGLPGPGGVGTEPLFDEAAGSVDPVPAEQPYDPGAETGIPVEDGTGPTPAPPPQPPVEPEPPAPATASPRRRPLLVIAAVAAISLGAVAVGVAAALRPGAGEELAQQVPGPNDRPPGEEAVEGGEEGEGTDEEGSPDVAEHVAPTDVALDDSGDTVEVAWTDNTDGQAVHQVVGGPVGADPVNLADVEIGTSEARVSGLEATEEYCFIVVAVLSVDEIAPSEETCTDRGEGG